MGSGKRGLAGGLVAMAVGGMAWGADGVPTLGEVEVRGTPLDSATTEGSGSYTSPAVTVAGKEAVPRREIPNSVSVVTRQQMDDQAMDDVLQGFPFFPVSAFQLGEPGPEGPIAALIPGIDGL